jgi:hypothetical protein
MAVFRHPGSGNLAEPETFRRGADELAAVGKRVKPEHDCLMWTAWSMGAGSP